MKLLWLEESLVGTTFEYLSMEEIRKDLVKEGLDCIRVKYLRDKRFS